MNTEEFWRGEFGDEYSLRNEGVVNNNYCFFEKIIHGADIKYAVSSVVEFGAGTGQNIRALRMLMLECNFTAVEINESAAKQIPCTVYKGSIFDFTKTDPMADLVLTKGLLIHIPPEKINIAYDIMYRSSKKYILICEYYNPVPVEVEYRGHSGKLWKRDFCGEIRQRYPDLKLADYGFTYHGDEYPQDDLTWFLLEKPNE